MKKLTFLIVMVLSLALASCVNKPDLPAQDDYVEVYRYAYMALQEGQWPAYKRLMRVVIDRSTASGAPQNNVPFSGMSMGVHRELFVIGKMRSSR